MSYFAIVRMSDSGEFEIIDGYDDEETADIEMEKYCDRFPNAYIDVHEINTDPSRI